jgi:hypothetical protein
LVTPAFVLIQINMADLAVPWRLWLIYVKAPGAIFAFIANADADMGCNLPLI